MTKAKLELGPLKFHISTDNPYVNYGVFAICIGVTFFVISFGFNMIGGYVNETVNDTVIPPVEYSYDFATPLIMSLVFGAVIYIILASLVNQGK